MSFFDVDYCRRCDVNPVGHQEDYCDTCIEEMNQKWEKQLEKEDKK